MADASHYNYNTSTVKLHLLLSSYTSLQSAKNAQGHVRTQVHIYHEYIDSGDIKYGQYSRILAAELQSVSGCSVLILLTEFWVSHNQSCELVGLFMQVQREQKGLLVEEGAESCPYHTTSTVSALPAVNSKFRAKTNEFSLALYWADWPTHIYMTDQTRHGGPTPDSWIPATGCTDWL